MGEMKGATASITALTSPQWYMTTTVTTFVNVSQPTLFPHDEKKQPANTCGIVWNRDGYKAELLFDIECSERDITSCKPMFDSCSYDRITDSNGCLKRVQIKSTGQKTNTGQWVVGCENNE